MKKNFSAWKTYSRGFFMILGLFVFFGLNHSAFALPFTATTIGGAGREDAESVIQVSDGGYVVVGKTNSYGAGDYDFYIAKLTNTGVLDTSFGTNGTRTVGGADTDEASSVAEAHDGGYVVAGSTESFSGSNRSMYIVKFTTAGDLDTSFGVNGTLTVGGYDFEDAESIVRTSDDGFIIAGRSSTFGPGVGSFYIVKITSTGVLDTSFGTNGTVAVGGSGNEHAYSIIQTDDGGYAAVGDTQSYGAGDRDIYIVKLTSTGALDATFGTNGTRTVGGWATEYGYSLIQAGDGGYVIVGSTGSFGEGSYDGYVIKLTNAGALDATFGTNGTRTVGGSSGDYILSVVEANDGYVVAGHTSSYGQGSDMYLAKFTHAGDLDTSFGVNGTITIGGYSTDDAKAITKDSQGGYIVTGRTYNFGAGSFDIYVVGITDDGDLNECAHETGSGGVLGSGGVIGSGGSVGFGGTLGSVGSLGSGGTLIQQCAAPEPITDITITNPNSTKISTAITDTHISLDSGTIDNTSQATTNVNLTVESTSALALFPTNTVITRSGGGNFNFQNFTIEDVTVENAIAAFELGIPGTNLSFSQDVTVTLNVGTEYDGQTLTVYSQTATQTDWTTHGTCTVTEGNCTFTTDHATTYSVGGQPAAEPIDLNVEVQDTLTLDCYDTQGTTGDYTVTLGTTTDPGKVTPGSPAVGQSTCTVTTNDDQGYYLTLIDDNAATNTVLTHTDPHTGSIYEIQDLTQFPATTAWTIPTTKGLGFSVVTFPDTQTTNNTIDDIWTNTSQCPEGNNPDTNTYAGIPDTAETISAVTQYESLSTTTNICYKVDVPASQASGQYTGSVTYTATSDASSYLN